MTGPIGAPDDGIGVVSYALLAIGLLVDAAVGVGALGWRVDAVVAAAAALVLAGLSWRGVHPPVAALAVAGALAGVAFGAAGHPELGVLGFIGPGFVVGVAGVRVAGGAGAGSGRGAAGTGGGAGDGSGRGAAGTGGGAGAGSGGPAGGSGAAGSGGSAGSAGSGRESLESLVGPIGMFGGAPAGSAGSAALAGGGGSASAGSMALGGGGGSAAGASESGGLAGSAVGAFGPGLPPGAALAAAPAAVALVAGWIVAGATGRATPGAAAATVAAALVLAGVVLVGTRVTGQRDRLEAERADLIRLRTEMVTTVSHELRTPLTVIQGVTATLNRRWDVLTEPERMDLIDVLTENVASLDASILHFVDAARLERGEVVLAPYWVSLTEVLDIALNRRAAAVAGYPIQRDVEAEMVWADRTALERILEHLVMNAARFSPVGLPITIRSAAGPSDVTISVTDRGQGIAPNLLPTVWEPLQRGDVAETGVSRGAGLGLPIVRELARLHGGDATLHSSRGHGTTVRVTLPIPAEAGRPPVMTGPVVADTPATAAPAPAAAPRAGRRGALSRRPS